MSLLIIRIILLALSIFVFGYVLFYLLFEYGPASDYMVFCYTLQQSIGTILQSVIYILIAIFSVFISKTIENKTNKFQQSSKTFFRTSKVIWLVIKWSCLFIPCLLSLAVIVMALTRMCSI